MKKYHINLKTGEPGLCRAEISCPFGLPLESHYDSLAEAQSAFESLMKRSNHVSIKKKRTQLSPLKLASVMDVELLRNMIKGKWIKVSKHPLDSDLKILCYTEKTQEFGKWNSATKLARGLIVKGGSEDFTDSVIVERPWAKFYTLQQIDSKWSLGDEENTTSASSELSRLDFNAPAEVTDKLDGSLGILYRSPDGSPALSTKGSFDSKITKYYNKILQKDSFREAAENLLNNHSDKTFAFELVGSNNKVVLDYDKDDIVLLGAVDKRSGVNYSPNDFKEVWGEDNGLSVTETLSAKTVSEAFDLPSRANREGVVIRIVSDDPSKQLQVKIKQDDYKRLHSLRRFFSKDQEKSFIRDSELTYNDILDIGKNDDLFINSSFEKFAKPENYEEGVRDIIAERRDRMLNAFKEKSRYIEESKKYVDSLPDDLFKLDERVAFKAISKDAIKLGNNKFKHVMNIAKARMHNEDIFNSSADRLLNEIAREI